LNPRSSRNPAASVLALLLKEARRTGDDYQALLNAYICERFLYRLGLSSMRDRFVLKGALLLRIWSHQPYRATRDLDLLRRGNVTPEAIQADIEAICRTEVDTDGIEFDLSSIRSESVRLEDQYAGMRFKILVRCGSAQVTFQLDIGVGDSVWPEPKLQDYPSLLDFPAPLILAYPPESVVAEKFESIVVLGERNSRIKDYYDLYYLAGNFRFRREVLVEAIQRTFAKRGTPYPEGDPIGLTPAYWENPARSPQVRSFVRRAGLKVEMESPTMIMNLLRLFLLPLLDDLRRGFPRAGTWVQKGSWRDN
jgi:predicted nucleotidyltransferase component of viral defense system